MRAIAKTFHENVQIVNQAVVAAYFQNKKTVLDTMNFVREYLVKKATNFKCEDVLTADVSYFELFWRDFFKSNLVSIWLFTMATITNQ